MSDVIAWIAAEAEFPGEPKPPEVGESHSSEFDVSQSQFSQPHVSQRQRDPSAALRAGMGQTEFLTESLPAHQFPARPGDPAVAASLEQLPLDEMLEPEEERQRRIYRRRTVQMLRRYMRYSIETGRLPSLLGKEFFRAKVTAHTAVTFEDRVIFVHDMENCMGKLDEFSRQLVTRVILQEYEHDQAAQMIGCSRMTLHRKLLEALDRLVGILLEVGLLEPVDSNAKKSCQGGPEADFCVSDCEERK